VGPLAPKPIPRRNRKEGHKMARNAYILLGIVIVIAVLGLLLSNAGLIWP
jgi:hypothetical protein